MILLKKQANLPHNMFLICYILGCQAVAASAYMRTRGQNELADYDDMISNLIRLLRLDHTTRPVIAAVIHAINSLCIGKLF